MIKIGLTGSIGMGKTTTAQLFRDEGYLVFDADKAVHSLYKKGGAAVPLIRSVFPDAILPNGDIDRKALGRHMQKDALNLQVLESFIHPMVAKLRKEFISRAKALNHDFIVFDVPLLFETGGEKYVDEIIVVTAPKAVQRERVMARPDMTKDLFEKLLLRQMPDKEKRSRADYLIFTDKGLDFAREHVQKTIRIIKEKYAIA